jgi:glycosyltransferase involved in cell wall biosynthesis
MIIGLDGKRAFFNHSGLGNYSRLVIQALLDSNPEVQIICYLPKTPKLAPAFLDHPRFHVVFLKGGNLKRTIGFADEIATNGCDVYWGLSNELPLGHKPKGIPYWVTIHDVIWYRYPHLFSWIDRTIYKFKTLRTLKRADRIIAVSTQTKNDLIEIFGADPKKIEVIGQNCETMFYQTVEQELKTKICEKYGLIPNQFLVQVGTVEERKNGELSIRALKESGSKKTLAFFGRKTKYQEILSFLAQELGIPEQVKFYNQAVFSDLPAIYQSAIGSVYPSHFEGFGIPVLESIASSTPLLVATGSCLEETAGPCATVVSPTDVHGAALWIQQLPEMKKPHPERERWLQNFNTAELAKRWLQSD